MIHASRNAGEASWDLISALKVDDFTVEDVPIEEIIREVFLTRKAG